MNIAIRNLVLGASLAGSVSLAVSVQAASSMATASLDAISVSTTGTAAVSFTGPDFLTALGTTTEGTADVLSDGELFDSQFGPFGEGTATNAGFGAGLVSASFADAANMVPGTALSSATTFAELALELSGAGDITFEFDYTLDVDAFDSDFDGFGEAGIEVDMSFLTDPLADTILVDGVGIGDAGLIIATLSFTFAFDDFGFGPESDVLFIETFANAQASVVPVPAAVWLFASAILGLLANSRKKLLSFS